MKLRAQGFQCRRLHVFALTSQAQGGAPETGCGVTRPLPVATEDTRRLAAAAVSALREIYRPGVRYRKVGVMLLDLSDRAAQGALDLTRADRPELMAVLDRVNARYGRETLRLAGQGVSAGWRAKAHACSPRYTSRWEDLRAVGSA